jgi:hypothetical protein
LEEGDRVRVKSIGRTGKITGVVEVGNTKRYMVLCDAGPDRTRPLDGALPPEAGRDWAESDLEPAQ